MNTAHPKILIIIVTWNKKEYVINLLNSLNNINYARESLDIVVVDNASTDGTVSALEQHFPTVNLIKNSENIGGTGGFNTGLTWAFEQPETQYDYLWLLDNDVVVHKNALRELVTVLDENADAAVAGSTMLQLDYPWQINEMGAFVNLELGSLVLNRHFEPIPSWRNKKIAELLQTDEDLTELLIHCRPTLDVDYVAAASLLIRAPIAKQAGLWLDFFIHFDDVEWCLRIARMGHRILASAKSMIWHLSAAAKVPSWVLYYDNRNILYLLAEHNNPQAVKRVTRWIAKKALYYALLGKQDLAQLHLDAIEDFQHQITGKKAIQLTGKTSSVTSIETIFQDPNIKRVLISCTVNCQATKIQSEVVKVLKQRPDLQVFYLHPPKQLKAYPGIQIPRTKPVYVSNSRLLRYWDYFKLRHSFDLVFQSDYHPIIPLSWLGKQTIFINDENFCLRQKPTLKAIIELLPTLWRYYKG